MPLSPLQFTLMNWRYKERDFGRKRDCWNRIYYLQKFRISPLISVTENTCTKSHHKTYLSTMVMSELHEKVYYATRFISESTMWSFRIPWYTFLEIELAYLILRFYVQSIGYMRTICTPWNNALSLFTFY